MKKNKGLIILGFIGLYLFSAGVSWAGFVYLNKPDNKKEISSPVPDEGEEGMFFDVSAPKTEVCMLNGEKFSKAAKERWLKRRPLTVMIENHEDSRPQSGLAAADIIYEAVAEGGVTRFLGVFYCRAQAKEAIIGPVRSARTYFLDWASEYGGNPLYTHVGGAHCDPQTKHGCLNGAKADALGQIREYGWSGENDLNQFSIGYPTFWRDYERLGRTVATEHTMYSTTERLWSEAENRGWEYKGPEGTAWEENFIPWKFTEKTVGEQEALTIEFPFWEGYSQYAVKWEYEPESDQYLRYNGGEAHMNKNTDQQLKTKNIAVLFMRESSANDGYPDNVHLLYDNIGEGEALIFQQGKVIEGTWEKESRLDRTKFYTADEEEIEFVPGQIWLEILPLGTEVSY